MWCRPGKSCIDGEPMVMVMLTLIQLVDTGLLDPSARRATIRSQRQFPVPVLEVLWRKEERQRRTSLLDVEIYHLLEAFNHAGESDDLLHLDLFLNLLREKTIITLVVVKISLLKAMKMIMFMIMLIIMMLMMMMLIMMMLMTPSTMTMMMIFHLVDVDHLHLAFRIRGSVLQNLAL